MSKPFVVLATPSFERRPVVEYVVSMLQTEKALAQNKIDHAAILLGGDPYLAKVRDRLASSFLTDYPAATDLFFFDDDVGWPEHKVIEFLHRPEDIIVGVYPKKQDNLEFPVTLHLEAGQMVERNGLYRAHLVPTGFMRIKRHVIEKMAQRVGKYQEIIPGGQTRIMWNLFRAGCVDMQTEALRKADLDGMSRDDLLAHLKRAIGLTVPNELGEYWGEDFHFAQRWREMGGEIWCDPDIAFSHRGSKAWTSNFGDSIRATLAAQPQKAA